MNEEERKAAEAKAIADAAAAEASKAAEAAKAKEAADAKAKADADAKALAVKGKLTKKQRILFAKDKIDRQLKELGDDDGGEEDGDDEIVTVGMLKDQEKQKSKDSALIMADSITDADERKDVKDILNTRIVPSGNAEADFKAALALANVSRNSVIAQELARKVPAGAAGSGSGAPAKNDAQFVPTASEARMMQPPYKLSKEDILKAREKERNS